ncbi:MAG TPA: sulfur oxidation c-type cytochrome SoxX [Burkholderiaceae bacterium]|nr:sulfur oxidation c-type cytochrome SoxX [Burkholderiaceae bacterium]
MQRAASIAMLSCAVALSAWAQREPGLRSTYTVVGDGIPKPLTDEKPNVENGRRIVTDRLQGLCVMCHSGPFPEARFQGNLATNLAGAGSRWSEAQLRLRLVDASRLNPQTIMPSYYRTENLERVGWQWRGQPILSAQQIEDVVAFLRTMRDAP